MVEDGWKTRARGRIWDLDELVEVEVEVEVGQRKWR
jgi:hypothetical protein